MQKVTLSDICSDIRNGKDFSAKTEKDISCVEHIHIYAEFVCVTSGTLDVICEGSRYTLNKGESMLIMPYEIHAYETVSHNEAMVIIFTPQLIDEMAKYRSFVNHRFTVNDDTIERLASFVEKSSLMMCEIKLILYTLFCAYAKENPIGDGVSQINSLCAEALSYIDSHFADDISLVSVSKVLNCHHVHLSRIFTRHTGFSFTSYLNRVRVVFSLWDLNRSELTVTEVAYKNGFNSTRSYNRAFMKYMQRTPGEYRRESRRLLLERREHYGNKTLGKR